LNKENFNLLSNSHSSRE